MNRAQAYRRRKRIQMWCTTILLCVTLVFSAFVSLNTYANWLPRLKWTNIYHVLGLGEKPYSDLPCTVRVFNIGAADCMLITCEGKHVLVDTGTAEQAESVVLQLKRLNIPKLDGLILTHFHDDHVGGVETILQHFSPEQVWVGNRISIEDAAYHNTMQVLLSTDAEIHTPQSGDNIQIGALKIEVISDGSAFKDENNRSIILRAHYKNRKMLFMGDAEKQVEQFLLQNQADISADWIKIAHHGSKTSSSGAFLKAVAPQYATITCDTPQSPDEVVLKNLETLHVQVARSDLNGTVLFATDGFDCAMFTEKS